MTSEIKQLFSMLESKACEEIKKTNASWFIEKIQELDKEYEKKAEYYIALDRERQQKTSELSRISFLS